MLRFAPRRAKTFFVRLMSAVTAVSFAVNLLLPPAAAQAQNALNLPVPGTMVSTSPAFVPVLLKGMTLHPEDPVRFDFIIDSGNTDADPKELKEESERLVKYFLAAMTIPKNDLWVNLSPEESDRIIPAELAKTELGRDMLAQDYLLKQLSASLFYPEKELGEKFWKKIYDETQTRFGTREIPVNTFNKVWIVPEKAVVYEHGRTVYIVESKLKVMLDSDYTMWQNNKDNPQYSLDQTSEETESDQAKFSAQIVKAIVIPEIEREVNEGKNFAPLRQIYHSLILAKWYKETVKGTLLSQVYVDQGKVDGIQVDDESFKEQIYGRYMEAYKQGVFNYIKEDYDQSTQEVIPRKYLSGGVEFGGDTPITHARSAVGAERGIVGKTSRLRMRMEAMGRTGHGPTEKRRRGVNSQDKQLRFLRKATYIDSRLSGLNASQATMIVKIQEKGLENLDDLAERVKAESRYATQKNDEVGQIVERLRHNVLFLSDPRQMDKAFNVFKRYLDWAAKDNTFAAEQIVEWFNEANRSDSGRTLDPDDPVITNLIKRLVRGEMNSFKDLEETFKPAQGPDAMRLVRYLYKNVHRLDKHGVSEAVPASGPVAGRQDAGESWPAFGDIESADEMFQGVLRNAKIIPDYDIAQQLVETLTDEHWEGAPERYRVLSAQWETDSKNGDKSNAAIERREELWEIHNKAVRINRRLTRILKEYLSTMNSGLESTTLTVKYLPGEKLNNSYITIDGTGKIIDLKGLHWPGAYVGQDASPYALIGLIKGLRGYPKSGLAGTASARPVGFGTFRAMGAPLVVMGANPLQTAAEWVDFSLIQQAYDVLQNHLHSGYVQTLGAVSGYFVISYLWSKYTIRGNVNVLNSPKADPNKHTEAIKFLANNGSEKAVTALLGQLGNDLGYIRYDARAALTKLNVPRERLIKVYFDLLQNAVYQNIILESVIELSHLDLSGEEWIKVYKAFPPTEGIQKAIAVELERRVLSYTDFIDRYEEWLNSSADFVLKVRAISFFERMRDENAIKILSRQLRNPDSMLAARAKVALKRKNLPTDMWVQLYVDMLRSGDRQSMFIALAALKYDFDQQALESVSDDIAAAIMQRLNQGHFSSIEELNSAFDLLDKIKSKEYEMYRMLGVVSLVMENAIDAERVEAIKFSSREYNRPDISPEGFSALLAHSLEFYSQGYLPVISFQRAIIHFERSDSGKVLERVIRPEFVRVDRGIKIRVARSSVRESKDTLGGIDMNDIPVERQGEGAQIPFEIAPAQEFLNAPITGFRPVIINIQPLPSILPLLGLDETRPEDIPALSAL